MRRLLLLAFLTTAPLLFAGEEVRVYTFIEPSCCQAPTTHEFFISPQQAEAWATARAYQPTFSLTPSTAIASVRAALQVRYPDLVDFSVFHCTVGWHGLRQGEDGSMRGFEYAFVLASPHAHEHRWRRDDPRT